VRPCDRAFRSPPAVESGDSFGPDCSCRLRTTPRRAFFGAAMTLDDNWTLDQ
jgi:hypothetical protein